VKWIVRLILFLYQSVFMAIGQIASNKVRSLLTTVGIVIGVAAVVAVVSALSGLQKKVLDDFQSLGTDKLFIFPRWPESMQRTPGGWTRIRFATDLFEDMRDYTPNVSAFTRIRDTRLNVGFAQRTLTGVQVTAIDTDWHRIERRFVSIGRPFTLVDSEQARPVALVNQKAQEQLGLDRDPTGQAILINQRRFTIVGVVDERAQGFLFGDNNEGAEVVIPFTTMMRMEPNAGFWVIATARTPDLAAEAAAEITFFLRARRGIGPLDEPNFGVEYVQRFVEQFKQLATAITIAATGIVAISLAVGGVGIMNIMLVSVSERTREIGLRKAVGARPSAILFQFLIEAVVLCCVGGAIGVVIGWGIMMGLRQIPGSGLDAAFIPVWAVVLAFGFSAGVGVVFGMFPAVKAARLDPIEALRHE
jgi:putative ABC transport system permease protein